MPLLVNAIDADSPHKRGLGPHKSPHSLLSGSRLVLTDLGANSLGRRLASRERPPSPSTTGLDYAAARIRNPG
jgi:hypothetical protein